MAEKRQNETKSRSEPKIPKGHFNEEGMSQGKEKGPVRPTPDAHNERNQEGK